MLASPRATSVDDRLARLEAENAELKKQKLEKDELVKKLGVQMVRIRSGLQEQAAPKGAAPLGKARGRAELSKADRIAQLEVELSHRDMREERLQQQLMLAKHSAGSATTRPGVSRQKKPRAAARPHSASAEFAPSAAAGGAAGLPAIGGGGAAAEAAAGSAALSDERLSSMLQMLQEKDRQVASLQAQLASLELSGGGMAARGGAAAAGGDADGEGGAVGLEIRRQLKKSVMDLTLLQQRYDHLDARFNTLRDNHEKVLSKMSDLNKVIREERQENNRLRQELVHAQSAQEDVEEKALAIEGLVAEKAALEDENRRILAKAFSNDDAGEISRTRSEVALRDAEIARLKERLKKEEDRKKVIAETSSTSETKLVAAQAARDLAEKTQAELVASAAEKSREIAELQQRLDIFSGGSPVSPQDFERALAMIRDGADPGDGQPEPGSLRLVDTDLSAMGLSPLHKKEVHSILMQNNDLIMQLEKAELLLKNQTQLVTTLTAELKAQKKSSSEEISRLQKQQGVRTQELAGFPESNVADAHIALPLLTLSLLRRPRSCDMVRIRSGLQEQAAPKGAAPLGKA
eukprot:gene9188-5256_t